MKVDEKCAVPALNRFEMYAWFEVFTLVVTFTLYRSTKNDYKLLHNVTFHLKLFGQLLSLNTPNTFLEHPNSHIHQSLELNFFMKISLVGVC